MKRIDDLPYLARWISRMGLECGEGLFWKSSRCSSARNVVCLDDHIVELAPECADLRKLDVARYRSAIAVGGRIFARSGQPDISRLVAALGDILGGLGSCPVLLLTTNHGPNGLTLEPWIMECDRSHLVDRPQVQAVFSDLGIGEEDVCGIEGSLPENLPSIKTLAQWYWTRYGRNLYLLCAERVKVIVCHEQDVHLCSADEDLMKAMIDNAERAGLKVAPYESQQCG
jgi:hypothetical protein